jgi:hypothetical protein
MGDRVKSFFKGIWAGWKKVAHKIGRFQTRVLLTVSYFLVVGPTWAVMKMIGADPLERRRKDREYFRECETKAIEGSGIDRARRQF